MNRSCRLLVAVVVTGWGIASASKPAAQPSGDQADTPSLDVQYAEAKLALAKANLQRAEARNKKVANAVSPQVVAEYQRDVNVANAGLEAANQGNTGEFAQWLAEAEAQWTSAKAAWQSAVAANKRKPETVHPLDVERLRLRAEMLGINLQRGRALAGAAREDQLQWRLSMLDDQVERLAEVVFRTAPARGSSPTVWYYYVPW